MSAAASRLAGTGIATCLLALLLGVAGCGGSSGEASTETTTTEETATTQTETTTTTTTTTEAPPAARMTIVVRDGASVGGIERRSVDKGDKVTLVVTADLTDEVHLHGYDLSADVAPGQKARIVFKATIPGRFEIELEERGIHIGELEVRP
jgi:uncharacterized cupredoxin-like copper-binding protein